LGGYSTFYRTEKQVYKIGNKINRRILSYVSVVSGFVLHFYGVNNCVFIDSVLFLLYNNIKFDI